MLKAREICKREAFNIPIVMICSYILDKGEAIISNITDDDIEKIEGNAMFAPEFLKQMVRAARAIVKECDQSEIVRLFKAEWCCAGEIYDPDLDQFVTDTTRDDYYD